MFQNDLNFVDDHVIHACLNVQAVSFPQTLQVVGNWAFAGCPNLVFVEVVHERNNHNFEIRNDAFSGCDSLPNICLPSEAEEATSVYRFLVDDSNPYVSSDFHDSFTFYQLFKCLYDNSPVHKKCCHTYVTKADALVEEIASLQQADTSTPHPNDLVHPWV